MFVCTGISFPRVQENHAKGRVTHKPTLVGIIRFTIGTFKACDPASKDLKGFRLNHVLTHLHTSHHPQDTWLFGSFCESNTYSKRSHSQYKRSTIKYVFQFL